MLRQYHPCALEKPLIQRFFAYKVFFRRTCQRKNEKCGVTAANTNSEVYRQIKGLSFRISPVFYNLFFIQLSELAYCGGNGLFKGFLAVFVNLGFVFVPVGQAARSGSRT